MAASPIEKRRGTNAIGDPAHGYVSFQTICAKSECGCRIKSSPLFLLHGFAGEYQQRVSIYYPWEPQPRCLVTGGGHIVWKSGDIRNRRRGARVRLVVGNLLMDLSVPTWSSCRDAGHQSLRDQLLRQMKS